ncbi:MAG: NADH-quinone oxidoreductase subunit M [Synechococcus sp. LacPavin_0920_WC12_MAG_50_7]|nr:NADH-quinone oxidoreductase subunit M [Synechococcus sp. LacPavin_0920_WC12_MAG_50_7]
MLSILLITPLLIGVLLPIVSTDGAQIRKIALAAPLIQLMFSLWFYKNPPDSIDLSWIPQIGLKFELGLDGISLPVVLLTALLTCLSIAATPADQSRPRLFFPLVLSVNLGLVTAFLAQNGLLFVLAYELILIPTTLLVAIWGDKERAGAATRFLIYGALSGVVLLAVVFSFGWLNPSGLNFSYSSLRDLNLSSGQQRWLLGGVLLAFGLKLPVFPLHGWQPRTYSQSPIPVVMLLSGAVSKMGAYGLIRFGLEFLPDGWLFWSGWIAALGAFSAIYGALNAISQTDIRKLVAYSSLGHMGLLVLALAAATPLSLQGVVVQMLAHGLIIALLFYLVGLIEIKTKSRNISELSGLLNPQRGLPFTASLLLIGLMAAAGVPGLAGFVAELLIFEGSWSRFPWPTLFCLIASGLTAVYAVRLFNRVCFGRLDQSKAKWPSTSWRERIPAVILSLLVIVTGIWPSILTGFSEPETSVIAKTQFQLLQPELKP